MRRKLETGLVWEEGRVDWSDSCMAGRRVMVGCCSVSRPDPRAAAAAALINETPTGAQLLTHPILLSSYINTVCNSKQLLRITMSEK